MALNSFLINEQVLLLFFRLLFGVSVERQTFWNDVLAIIAPESFSEKLISSLLFR